MGGGVTEGVELIMVDEHENLFTDHYTPHKTSIYKVAVPVAKIKLPHLSQNHILSGSKNRNTDLVATQEALRQSEARFRAIFERSCMGIGLADIKGQIIDSNSALCEMLGYSREELRGKHFIDCLNADEVQIDGDLNCLQNIFAEGLKNPGATFTFQYRCRHKDGSWRHIEASACNLLDDPNVAAIVIDNRDITERHRYETEMCQARDAAEAGSRAKSEFLATMSHELRTPLNAIMGLSQLLQQELFGSLNEKQKEYIDCIYSSGEHLLALINDILDLSKVEAAKEELILQEVPIQQLCDYAVRMVRDRADGKGLQLTTEIEEQATTFIADEQRSKQMLLNLLTNAIKFTPSGSVSLQVKKVPQGTEFIVADTGIGIATDKLNLLFQPFQQLDSRLNRHYEGTGLGLALTRKLARLHGGDVTVESTLGIGSRFTLFFPDHFVQQEEDIENIPPTHPPTNFTKKRILIVQEDDRTAKTLQDYLLSIGYQVERIANKSDCLQQVLEQQPDLILIDMQCQDHANIDLLHSLRQEPMFKDLTVIAMISTGMASESWLKAGADDYLLKPIGIIQLESILMRHFIE